MGLHRDTCRRRTISIARIDPSATAHGNGGYRPLYVKDGTAVTDQAGRSDLHYAASEGEAATLGSLLADGADPNLADGMGWTPLHFAAQGQHAAVVRQLVDAGAETDPQDVYGKTPLAVALFNSGGQEGTVAALLEAGADPDLENYSGISPRKLAETIANYDLSEMFPT